MPRRSGLEARFVLIIVGLRAAPGFIGGVQVMHLVTINLIAPRADSMPGSGRFEH